MLILDAIHYKVREEGIVVKKAAYIVIRTDLEGKKDVLGIWFGATESSKYWLSVLNGLKNRGIEDIPIASIKMALTTWRCPYCGLSNPIFQIYFYVSKAKPSLYLWKISRQGSGSSVN